MSWLRRLIFRLRPLFGRRKIESDLAAELETHLEMHIEALCASGMSLPEARREALRQLGGLEQVKEAYRDQRGYPALARAGQSIRSAVRQLKRQPLATWTIVFTLAVGIGATTAIYTVFYDSLLASDGLPNSDRLFQLFSHVNGYDNSMSSGDFLDWRKQSQSFDHLAAMTGTSFTYAGFGEPQQFAGRLISPGFYEMTGIPLLLGRDFLPEEELPGQDHVVILSYGFWNRMGSDRRIIGRPIQLNGQAYTIVGVLADSVAASRYLAALAAPLAFRPEQINHSYHWLAAFGRLKAGISRVQAGAELNAIADRIAQAYPESNTGWGVSLTPLHGSFVDSDRRRALWLLLFAVGVVLLITCANVANLLLVKGAARQKEIAVRIALGASRSIVFAQFLIESAVLALLGGGCGVALAAVLLRLFKLIAPQWAIPRAANLGLDLPVLLASAAITAFAAIGFGCVPAWHASQTDPGRAMKETGRTGSAHFWLRRILIVGEIALAVTLMAATGLAIRSFVNLTRIDTGIRTDHVLSFRLNHPSDQFRKPEQIEAYYRRVLESIRAVPGATQTAAVSGLPLQYASDGMSFSIAGGTVYADPSKRPGANFQSVTPGYFETFGIPILEGRGFDDHDRATGVRVAMVNEEFVRRYFPKRDALRQRLLIEQLIPGLPTLGPVVEWQIVGVFHDVRNHGEPGPFPEIDVPFAQSPKPTATMGVRTTGDPASMAKAVTAAVHAVNPTVAVTNLRTMDQLKEDSFVDEKFSIRLYLGFAAVALGLCAIGLYGLIAFSVSQRTHEIGIRMALGASREHVLKLIGLESGSVVLIGLALGLVGSWAVGRAMNDVLFGLGEVDWVVVGLVSVLLLAVSAVAAYLPARRAASIDPLIALRAE